MENENAGIDENSKQTLTAVTDDSNQYITRLKVDPDTGRLLVSFASTPGSGTVTDVSVVSANGFAGSVATSTSTPAITLSTTVTGILKGDGTAISAVTIGSGLSFDGTTLSASGGSGTVTSVGIAGTNGIGVVGSPITTNGTITLSLGSITPSAVQVSGLTASEIVITDASKNLVSAAVATYPSLTELTYLKGVTSSIQTQLGTKLSTITVASTTITSGTNTRILYNNSGVVGEYTLTGTGTVVAMQTAPSFLTSITTPSVLASSNDSGALGASGTAFADLFLASGAVINFNAGGYAITHADNMGTQSLTFAGGNVLLGTNSLLLTGSIASTGSRVTKGWFTDIESTNMPTVGGTSLSSTFAPIASPTFTGTVTIPASVTNGQNNLDGTPASDHTAVGPVTNTFAAGYTTAIGDLVFFGSGGKWLEVDADAVATCNGLLGIALEVKNDTEALLVALPGSFVRDDSWNWTVGATLYAGETLGAMQETIPTGADAIIKVVGFAVSADVIFFNPSQDQQSTVA